MANLAKTGVKVLSEWTEGGTNGRLLSSRKFELTLAAMGTVANKIPADVLGFRKIQDCSPAMLANNNSVIVATPSYDGSQVLLKAAASDAPADVTGIIRLTVRGD